MFSTWFGSRVYVTGSISTKSGVALAYTIQFALAKKVIGDVITISPGFQPSAIPIKCKAAVPLDTAQQYLAPKYNFKSLSNVFTVEASTRILFFKLEQDYWPVLKPFLILLNQLPETIKSVKKSGVISTVDIPLDNGVIQKLREL